MTSDNRPEINKKCMVVRSLSARKLQQELHESVACIKVLTGTSQRRRDVHRARPGVATANDRIQANCLPVPAPAVAIEQCMRPVIDDLCHRLADRKNTRINSSPYCASH